jgi:hypothetical protein
LALPNSFSWFSATSGEIISPLHRYYFGNNASSELFSKHFQNLGFVKGEIMAHCGRIKLDKQDLVFDKDLSGATCYWLSDQSFP